MMGETLPQPYKRYQWDTTSILYNIPLYYYYIMSNNNNITLLITTIDNILHPYKHQCK